MKLLQGTVLRMLDKVLENACVQETSRLKGSSGLSIRPIFFFLFCFLNLNPLRMKDVGSHFNKLLWALLENMLSSVRAVGVVLILLLVSIKEEPSSESFEMSIFH